MVLQLWVSVRTRDQRRDLTGDIWDGRNLEWSTASPPPPWNFAKLPQVSVLEEFWHAKQENNGQLTPADVDENDEALMLPKRSPIGFVTAFFCVVGGFAMVWHIWWMALLGIAGIVVTVIAHGWRTDTE